MRDMNPEKRIKIINLIERNEFAVVATFPANAAGAPQSAVLAISHDVELRLYFGSFRSTRKNSNLAGDPRISIVIGWDNTTKQTLQLEGTAAIVKDPSERMLVAERHVLKNPSSIKYQNDPRQVYFRVTPQWLRYSDFSVDPQEVWELTF